MEEVATTNQASNTIIPHHPVTSSQHQPTDYEGHYYRCNILIFILYFYVDILLRHIRTYIRIREAIECAKYIRSSMVNDFTLTNI